MAISKKPKRVKLEDSFIWRETCDIAEYVYTKSQEFPEMEKWDTQVKLRTSANESMYFLAQALGNTSPTNQEYDWGMASRSLSALKTMYRFAGRMKFLQLDPDIMLRIDNLLKEIDKCVKEAYEHTEQEQKESLDFWRKKYELAQKANGAMSS